ncbi:MAG: ATP-binding cassette domain-containing protein, partial [Chloroflexi bacterium]|nr:ATP-binding cassette domain-containing protein [Chloroflexota bacterium]
ADPLPRRGEGKDGWWRRRLPHAPLSPGGRGAGGEGGTRVRGLAGRIELRNVGFQYDPHAPLALRNISLTVEPGQKVALVGATGSGKSTLAMLLLGLYRPVEGEILFDGVPLSRLSLRTLRRQFGVVLQEPFLFAGSIRQNIAFNDPALSLERVAEAGTMAGIHDAIVQMPMGYETLVAEGGSGLSGGQRQCLALARAVAHRPAVLLLDEATSHLDVVTERRVDVNLSRLSCTRIVIAHRLSTIRNADLILVLDGGEIVERGSHEELLARGGKYAQLIRTQAQAEGSAPADPISTTAGASTETIRCTPVVPSPAAPPALPLADVFPVGNGHRPRTAMATLTPLCPGCGREIRRNFCGRCGVRATPGGG